ARFGHRPSGPNLPPKAAKKVGHAVVKNGPNGLWRSIRTAWNTSASASDVRFVTSGDIQRPAPTGGGAVSAAGATKTRSETGVANVFDTDEARSLLETGQESGSLTAEEIALALDELDLDASQMDDFYHALEELQIEVVQQREVDEDLDLEADTREV